jgi:hypothetical protein
VEVDVGEAAAVSAHELDAGDAVDGAEHGLQVRLSHALRETAHEYPHDGATSAASSLRSRNRRRRRRHGEGFFLAVANEASEHRRLEPQFTAQRGLVVPSWIISVVASDT